MVCPSQTIDLEISKSHTGRLLEVLLPSGGMVVVMEAYFDESGTHEGSPVMSIAGYIFEKDQCDRLKDSWAATLTQYQLPYFRMSECANGTGGFAALSMADRVACERSMINHIKTRMTLGFAVSMSQAEFSKMAPPHFINVFGDAYVACTVLAMASVGYWARKSGYTGDVAYFFESGHSQQSDAEKRMRLIDGLADRRSEFRYISHTFADKRLVLPLQAADLLAWQWRKGFIDMFGAKRRRPRLDLVALLKDSPYSAKHFTGDLLARFMQSSIDDFERRWCPELEQSNSDWPVTPPPV